MVVKADAFAIVQVIDTGRGRVRHAVWKLPSDGKMER